MYLSEPNAPPDGNQPRRPWLVLAVAGAAVVVIGNVVALAVYLKRSAPVAVVAPPPAPAPDPVQSLAVQQRDQGVEALRVGQYSLAVTKLEAAAKLDPELAQVTSLLEVARKLRDQPTDVNEAPPPPPPLPLPAPKPEAVAARTPRAPTRVRVEREPPRVNEAKSSGLLIVSTTPAKMLVQVDGQARDLTPTKLDLSVGAHRVAILDGSRVVLEREINLAPGAVVVINEVVPPEPSAAATVVAPPPSGLGADDKLNLVGLIDQPIEALAAREADRAAPAKVEPPPAIAPKSGRPKLVMYWPGANGAALRRQLGAAGLDVRLLDQSAEFGQVVQSEPADAYLASPAVLRQHGLQAALFGQGGVQSSYVAASLRADLSREQLATFTLGVVDELGKKEMPALVARIIGSAQPPKLRRVPKVEDLLPLLQFKMAEAIIVKSSDFPALKARTQQNLQVLELGGAGPALAVAFAPGARRSVVEQALRGDGPRTELRVERWVSP
ncbi:MAG: hypothetical protein IPG45_14035 [Deltaproteobacteria bacterium]|nr:hypothetical protein [Deltaproteobacteria bacterium]